ncbi:hypothetical protein AAHI06_24380 [Pseudomonas salmasensis]|uniref:hypothetical protein n=1 Tax=Pseudomonas salmasensis TaxID=2745514 RepID=UPI0032196E60
MNKNSYVFVIPVAIGMLVSLALAWVFVIWPSVHFKPLAEKICLIASPVLAIVLMLYVARVRKTEWLRKKLLDRLRFFLGTFIASAMAMISLLAVVILLTSATLGTYTTQYEYTTGGSRSCSGILVFDTEVNKQIKICHAGGSGDQGWATVEKRSGPLGIVVTNATPALNISPSVH